MAGKHKFLVLVWAIVKPHVHYTAFFQEGKCTPRVFIFSQIKGIEKMIHILRFDKSGLLYKNITIFFICDEKQGQRDCFVQEERDFWEWKAAVAIV